jgi:sRNA-binding carbon storage regulator CsrA
MSMAYLRKSLKAEQEIVVTLSPDADREELAKRLVIDGVRLKVLEGLHRGAYKIGVMAPAGLTPVRKDKENIFKKSASVRCLALTRSVGEEIVVTLRDGSDASVVLDWLENEGLTFHLTAVRPNQCVIGVLAIDELLVLREELRTF